MHNPEYDRSLWIAEYWNVFIRSAMTDQTTQPDLMWQFQDVHSPDKLSDHDIVSGTLKIFIPPKPPPPPANKETSEKVYLYEKGDMNYEDTLEFAKEKYFSGHSDTRLVHVNFHSRLGG